MKSKKIIEDIYDYYPTNILPDELDFDETIEIKNLMNVLSNPPEEEASAEIYERLQGTYGKENTQNMTLFDWGNPCYHFRVHVEQSPGHWNNFIIFISTISKYYYIYVDNDLWKTKQITNEKVYNEIINITSSELKQYELLDPSIAREIIPDLAYEYKKFGEVTVLHCLFTTHIY